MPVSSTPPVRVRLREDGVRTTVDVSGDAWHARVGPDLSRRGHSVDAAAEIQADRFDMNAGVRLDGNGARANGELRTASGPLSGAVHTSIDSGGLRTGARGRWSTGAGGVGVDIGRGEDGLSTALDVGTAIADAAEVQLRASHDARGTVLHGALSLRASASLGLPALTLEGEHRVEAPHLVEPDDSEIGQLRARVLQQRPGARFIAERTARDGDAGADMSVHVGVASARLSTSVGKGREASFIRLQDPARPHPPSNQPFTADAVERWLPGEAASVTGIARVTLRGETGLELRNPIGARLGVSVGEAASVIAEGTLRLVVEREDGAYARVTLTRVQKQDAEVAREVDATPGLQLPVLASVRHPIGRIAADTMRTAGNDLLDAASPLGADSSSTRAVRDEVVRALRIDLSRDAVRRALDGAIQGDWRELEELDRDAGVELMRSKAVSSRADASRSSVHALGLSRASEVAEATGQTIASGPGGETRTQERSWSRATQWSGWLGEGRDALTHDERERVAGDLVRTVEGSLTWQSARTTGRLSPRRLDVALSVANLLGDDAARAHVEAYRRRLNAGRAESSGALHGARLSFAVTIDDDGLAHAATRPMEELWAHAARAWNATHPGEDIALWTRPAGRRSLEEHGPLRHGHADYAPYHEVRELLEAVRAPGQKHEVLRTLRALLAARPDDPFWIVCLGCAVCPCHAVVDLVVDLHGEDEALDFSLAP